MSSYIRYMFKYLFEPDALPAELASEQRQASGAPDPAEGSPSLGSMVSRTVGELSERLNQTAAPATTNKSAGLNLADWLWQAGAAATPLAPENNSAAPISSGSSWQLNANANARPASPLWPSKCLELARMFTAALATTTTTTTTPPATTSAHSNRMSGPNAAAGRLGSFAEFEHLIRQRQLLAAASSLANNSAAGTQHSLNSHWPANNWNASSAWLHVHSTQQQQQQAASSLELLECYNQLQLDAYYQNYDIFVGLRIATSLFILFSVFLLFVIYKTGCAGDGEHASRSQLRLTSSSSSSCQPAAARRLPLVKRRPSKRWKCACEKPVSKKAQAARSLVQPQAKGPLEAKAPAQDASGRPPDLETGQARQA